MPKAIKLESDDKVKEKSKLFWLAWPFIKAWRFQDYEAKKAKAADKRYIRRFFAYLAMPWLVKRTRMCRAWLYVNGHVRRQPRGGFETEAIEWVRSVLPRV